jgi:hypothetical protein
MGNTKSGEYTRIHPLAKSNISFRNGPLIPPAKIGLLNFKIGKSAAINDLTKNNYPC